MNRYKPVVLLLTSIAVFGILIALGDTLAGLRPIKEGVVSNPAGSPAMVASADGAIDLEQTDSPSIRWCYSQKPAALQGVALVIHGLNLRPDRMGPVIDNLTRSGIDVLSLSLRGHGDNYTHRDDMDSDSARLESFKNVSYPLWTNEAYLAYRQVQTRARRQNVPVFFSAFSIGGLIGLDLLASNPDVHFDKIVLLAPAISLRPTIYLERVLSPFPRLVIPSLADDAYLANKEGTTVAAYNALFEALYHFEDHAGPKLNVPTLIFIDEQDEFIPLGGLKKLVAEHHLNRWKFFIVEKEAEMGAGTFHHHILDASSTGKKVWQEMMAATITHLKE